MSPEPPLGLRLTVIGWNSEWTIRLKTDPASAGNLQTHFKEAQELSASWFFYTNTSFHQYYLRAECVTFEQVCFTAFSLKTTIHTRNSLDFSLNAFSLSRRPSSVPSRGSSTDNARLSGSVLFSQRANTVGQQNLFFSFWWTEGSRCEIMH